MKLKPKLSNRTVSLSVGRSGCAAVAPLEHARDPPVVLRADTAVVGLGADEGAHLQY